MKTEHEFRDPPCCPATRALDVARLCEVGNRELWRCFSSGTRFLWPRRPGRDWAVASRRDLGTGSIASLLTPSAASGAPRYVLEVGSGNGERLRAAAEQGWKCFGVEPDGATRASAIARHGAHVEFVAAVDELVPHAFDLVLVQDVIGRVGDPYDLLFGLFNAGAIGPGTTVLITAPDGEDAPSTVHDTTCAWPEATEVAYTEAALRILFTRLLFEQITIQREPLGTHGSALVCIATGSRFFGFMQERYVPGTWSKLAEYEHLPRYQFASRFTADRKVLDFGCGTGYGSRLLADTAAHVTGLDIDAAAIAWASSWHDPARLAFDRRDDLGAGLPDASFDVVTCFEMIEHVDHATQIATIGNISRLLKPEGRLVISTPNPAVTANYGDNPYHLREMDESSFRDLLSPAFAHVTILRQWIRPAVAIGEFDHDQAGEIVADVLPAEAHYGEPAAYVAVCSNRLIEAALPFVTFDASSDFVLVELRRQQAEVALRLESHTLRERATDAAASVAALRGESDRLQEESLKLRDGSRQLRAETRRLQDELANRDALLQEQGVTVARLTRYWADKEAQFPAMQRQVETARADLQTTAEHRDAIAARLAEWETMPLARYVRFAARQLRRVRRRLGPALPTDGSAPAAAVVARPTFAPYAVKVPVADRPDRPRVLHAIANFMTGGSSRLVVDLIERLGDAYAQRILTSFEPKPPEYLNLDVVERPMGTTRERLARDIAAFEPDLVHVHYWGDCDEPWYREVFAAAASLHVPILQNVNTPVAPFTEVKSDHIVFVSAYVQATFGQDIDSGEVVYPGSDFAHFEQRSDLLDHRCVGMVYRLEEDKLNASAIDVFIRIVQALPDIRCLIVGGGSLLEPFKARVHEAGLDEAFEFTGYVSYERLPALYARMGLFVAPVWKESFGQVSSFAMNMGMPVIGYDVGAIGEIVADPTLVAPAGDADALANIAIRLLDDRARRHAVMAANQTRAAGLFSVEAMVERYRAVYARLIPRAA